jgi:RNA polymerase sigma-70 factor (ECF subfamily)
MDARQLFEILVRDNIDSVRAFVMSSVRDANVADDIVQEAFVVSWKNLDRYDRERPFGPWVRGIAGKLILSHRRKVGRSKVMYLDDEVLGVLDGAFEQLQRLAGDTFDEKLDALRDCMRALSDQQRQAIALHYDDGLQCKDIAPRLGLQTEAVKKHLQRGRAALLKCIEGKLGVSLIEEVA